MKLDYIYDGSLKLSEEKPEVPKEMVESTKPSDTQQSAIITSPGTDDLGMKIASVKNVWASPFEHGMPSSSGPVPPSSTVNNSQPAGTSNTAAVTVSSQPFSSFQNTTSMNQSITQSINQNMSEQTTGMELKKSVPSSDTLAPSPGPVCGPVTGLGSKPICEVIFDDNDLMSSMSSTSVSIAGYMESDINKVLLNTSEHTNEQSNVCKVKPQLQTHGGSNMTQTVAHIQQTLPVQQQSAVHQASSASQLSAAVPPTIPPTSPQGHATAVLLSATSETSSTSNSLTGNLVSSSLGGSSLSGIASPPAAAAQSYIIAAPVSHYQQVFGSSQLLDQRVSEHSTNVLITNHRTIIAPLTYDPSHCKYIRTAKISN